MSNTKGGTCSDNNNTSSMIYGPNSYYMQQQSSPSPFILAKSPSILNNKLDMYGQPYDYNKYFFL